MTIEKQLENLSDALIENIINTPGDEILKEVEEDYGDPLYEANIMRGIIKSARNSTINKENKQ